MSSPGVRNPGLRFRRLVLVLSVRDVKSGCEKSWAEVQAVSFSFECRGCTKMKELEVELEQLRLLVAIVGREQVGCASGSGGGTVDDEVGEDDERGDRERRGGLLAWGQNRGDKSEGRKHWCKIVSGNKKFTIRLVYQSPNINEEDNTKIQNATKEVSKGECINGRF